MQNAENREIARLRQFGMTQSAIGVILRFSVVIFPIVKIERHVVLEILARHFAFGARLTGL